MQTAVVEYGVEGLYPLRSRRRARIHKVTSVPMLAFLDRIDEEAVEADICVVGAGPAGITLALQLADQGVSVVLLEGGGLAPPGPDELDLYRGEVSGRQYPLSGSRLRYFGGTTGHWGGWSRPLDAVDFAVKPHIEFSGWPLERADLDPWYERAHRWLEMPVDDYYQDQSPPFVDKLLPDVHGITTRFFRFSPPTRYGVTYRERVANSAGIRAILGANAVAVERGPRGDISAVLARSLTGKKLTVRSRYTVLAMGGIENARFLLNTETGAEAALGNHSDWLGRGFMDHAGWGPGTVVTRSELGYHRFNHQDVPVMPVLGIADEVLLNEELINCCGMLHPISFVDDVEKDYFSNSWFGGPEGLGEASSYRLQLIFEPSVCRDSRIQLTGERDAIGLRRARLNWAFNDSDFAMLSRSIDRFVGYLGQAGLGRLKFTKPVNKETTGGRIGPGFHHMGTTRMSADADTGVVNGDCRVHGVENLFIAGSSVFPAVGFSNPTLTIVALACRLADHLSRELQPS